MSASTPPSPPVFAGTGVWGLDDILLGGLPKNQTCPIEGRAGTGKTTLALQFMLEGKRAGEKCLYVTLSESKAELEAAAQSHGWSLDGISIAEFVPEEASLNDEDRYTVFHPGETSLPPPLKNCWRKSSGWGRTGWLWILFRSFACSPRTPSATGDSFSR